ncbi:hypothetical protein SALBM311S_02782 [Streptomyces alboniger]
MWPSRQQVRAYRRTAPRGAGRAPRRRCRRPHASARSGRRRTAAAPWAAVGHRRLRAGHAGPERCSPQARRPAPGYRQPPLGGTPARPWLGTCGEAAPPASASSSPSDPVRPVKAHRGKPPPPALPVPNTRSECHMGFCSGPCRAALPVVVRTPGDAAPAVTCTGRSQSAFRRRELRRVTGKHRNCPHAVRPARERCDAHSPRHLFESRPRGARRRPVTGAAYRVAATQGTRPAGWRLPSLSSSSRPRAQALQQDVQQPRRGRRLLCSCPAARVPP